MSLEFIAIRHIIKHMAPYSDRRIISIFILGIAQGLPWVMIGSTLTLWLSDAGVSRAQIGYAALIYSVYAINFLWSPIVDLSSIPGLSRIGRRQSWISFCLFIIAGTCFVISFADPGQNAKGLVLLCLLIASVSATQDIAIDAYRVDSFERHEGEKISMASGVITAGWWTGYAGIGAIPLFLIDQQWDWGNLYILLGAIALLIGIINVILPKPKHTLAEPNTQSFNEFLALSSSAPVMRKLQLAATSCLPIIFIIWSVIGSPGIPAAIQKHSLFIPSSIFFALALVGALGFMLVKFQAQTPNTLSTFSSTRADRTIAWVLMAVIAPMRDFFSRNGVQLALALLAFIFLFKLGEAFLGRMSILFYKEIGFSATQIATYSKLLTWWLTVIFALIGGIINAKLGLLKGLIISGIMMASTNLIFALIAAVGPNEPLYAIAVILDGFTAGWSTVAFVSFISLLCSHNFSATQYALMASLGNFGRTSIASIGGQVVDWLNGNWAIFFVLTTLMVIPSLIILFRLRPFIETLMKETQQQK